jgi:hypothetical protein
MPEDTGVFARFVAARRADPDRLQVPAQPLIETLRGALFENRPAAATPDAELQQLLDRFCEVVQYDGERMRIVS